MARRNFTPKFLLGVLDEPINAHNEFVDWSCSKIGGTADWMQSGVHNPLCKLCKGELPLILQVYCPLDGSAYHRTLYIFTCLNRGCWNSADSWIVLRSQKPDDSITTTSINVSEKSSRSSPSECWLENADDWEENNGNDNYGLETYNMSSTDNQMVQKWGKRNSSLESKQDSFQVHENVIDADGNNVFDVNNPDGRNRNVISQEDSILCQNTERLRHMQMNEHGNGGIVEGAVGIDPVDEATAEVESPDEGTITVETPIAPTPDTVAVLFSDPQPIHRKLMQVALKSWYLSVTEEPDSPSCQFSEHERDLLMHYQKTEGLNFNELFNRSCKLNNSEHAGESYEKAMPKHGDTLFHKMLSRLRLCPQQMLRYCREPDAHPIFISPPTGDILDPGRCSHCGDKRGFELQLLPSMIDALRVDGIDDPVVEYGTVILYTCQSSCWEDGDKCREEKLVIQADPDFDYFATLSQHRPVYK